MFVDIFEGEIKTVKAGVGRNVLERVINSLEM